MSYVDDEPFDEGSDAAERAPRGRSGGRGARGDRGGGARRPSTAGGGGGGPAALQQRGVRLAILVGLVLVVLLVLVTSIRGCQRDRLVDSYKTYLTAANSVSADSKQIGDELRVLLDNKDFKAPAQVGAAVKELADRADVLIARAEKLSPPDALKAPNRTLITTLEYRRDGLRELPAAIDSAVVGKDQNNQIATLAEPLRALGASDIIFKRSFIGPANQALTKDKIKDIAVGESYYFPGNTSDMTSLEGTKSILVSLRQQKPASGSGTSTTGGSKHGVGIVQVVALQGGERKQLVRGGNPTTLKATADLEFEVTIEDSGDFIESNVLVSFTYTHPLDEKGTPQTQTIATIDPGAAKAQKVTFKAPSPPYYRDTSQITVKVDPVPGEVVTTNNTYTYPVKFEISG